MFLERGAQINIFDPSDAVADESLKAFGDRGTGTSIFYISKESEVFRHHVLNLFGEKAIVKVVEI